MNVIAKKSPLCQYLCSYIVYSLFIVYPWEFWSPVPARPLLISMQFVCLTLKRWKFCGLRFFFLKHFHFTNASCLIMYAAKQAEGQRAMLLITVNCTFGWMWPYLSDSSIFFSTSFMFSLLTPSGPAFSSDPSSDCTRCPLWPWRHTVRPVNQHSPAHHAQWAADRYFSVLLSFTHTPLHTLSSWYDGDICDLEKLCHALINIVYLLCVFLSNVLFLSPFPPGLPTVPLLPSSTSPSLSPLTPLNPAATSFNPSTTLPGGWFLKHWKRTSSFCWISELSTPNIWKSRWVAEALQLLLYRFMIYVYTPFQETEKGLPQLH